MLARFHLLFKLQFLKYQCCSLTQGLKGLVSDVCTVASCLELRHAVAETVAGGTQLRLRVETGERVRVWVWVWVCVWLGVCARACVCMQIEAQTFLLFAIPPNFLC